MKDKLTWDTAPEHVKKVYRQVHGALAPRAWELDYEELTMERAGYVKRAGEWVKLPPGSVLQPDGSWKVPS